MNKNRTTDAGGAASAALGSVIQFPSGTTDSSVGPRFARSKQIPRVFGGLDVCTALQLLSAERLPGVESSVMQLLIGMSLGRGEAWPREREISTRTGIDVRLVRRALARLEDRGLLATRVLSVGARMPNWRPERPICVVGHPLRVLRPLPNGLPVSRISRSSAKGSGDPQREDLAILPQRDPEILDGRISRSAPPYGSENVNKIHDDDDRLGPANGGAFRDESAPGGSAPPPFPAPPRERDRWMRASLARRAELGGPGYVGVPAARSRARHARLARRRRRRRAHGRTSRIARGLE